MAGNGRYFCVICQKDFVFKSRYQRHTESAIHKLYVDAILEKESCLAIDEEDGFVGHQKGETSTESASLEGSSNEATEPFLLMDPSSEQLSCDPSCSKEDMHDERDHADSDEADYTDTEDLIVRAGDPDGMFHPFASKIDALAYLVAHSPRPMGQMNLKFIFYALRCLHPQLPCVSLISKQKLPGYLLSKMHMTTKGVPYYINSVVETMKICLATPDIAAKLVRFPMLPQKEIREMYQALKWRTDSLFFAPMAISPIGNIFVGDFVNVATDVGTICICHITQFLLQEGCSDVITKVRILQQIGDSHFVITQGLQQFPVSKIQQLLPDIDTWATTIVKYTDDGTSTVPLADDEYLMLCTPHPLKVKSLQCGGIPVVVVPLNVFCDDTSGNKSKVWNKFDSFCFQLAGLPREENAKLRNIHFICTSNKVSVLEMATGVAKDFKALEEGVVVYDAFLACNVILLAPILCFLCDNPRAAELCNHLGATTRKYCRICMADVSTGLTVVAEKRRKCQTLEQMQQITLQSTMKDKKSLRTLYGVRETKNSLFSLAVDLHQSTPVETLHTLLLGPYKYLLRSLMAKLSACQSLELCARIEAFSFSGFSMRLTRDIKRYYRSFVGRDFKTVAQLAPFIFYPYLTDGEKEVWLALSKVFKITYCDSFDPENIDYYRDVCQSFARAVHAHCPELRKKLKVHLVLHIPDNMLMFGPTSSFNTERCENFNGLIRLQNIYGNRMAPSRDIARAFAVQESIHFTCSGGCFQPSERCGDDLIRLYQSPPVQEFLIGNSPPSDKGIYQHGTLRKLFYGKPSQLKTIPISISELGTVSIQTVKEKFPDFTLLLPPSVDLTSLVNYGRATVDENGSLMHLLDYVKYTSHRHGGSCKEEIGVLAGCFTSNQETFCIIRYMDSVTDGVQHILNELECPLLCLTKILHFVPSVDVKHSISVVHECDSGCAASEKLITSYVERERVTKDTVVWTHGWNNPYYCLNVYCMRNNQL